MSGSILPSRKTSALQNSTAYGRRFIDLQAVTDIGIHEAYFLDGEVAASVDDKARAPLTSGKRLLPMPLIRHIDGRIVDMHG